MLLNSLAGEKSLHCGTVTFRNHTTEVIIHDFTIYRPLHPDDPQNDIFCRYRLNDASFKTVLNKYLSVVLKNGMRIFFYEFYDIFEKIYNKDPRVLTLIIGEILYAKHSMGNLFYRFFINPSIVNSPRFPTITNVMQFKMLLLSISEEICKNSTIARMIANPPVSNKRTLAENCSISPASPPPPKKSRRDTIEELQNEVAQLRAINKLLMAQVYPEETKSAQQTSYIQPPQQMMVPQPPQQMMVPQPPQQMMVPQPTQQMMYPQPMQHMLFPPQKIAYSQPQINNPYVQQMAPHNDEALTRELINKINNLEKQINASYEKK
jgi:hypothetical protein